MDHTEWMQSIWGDESVRSAARKAGLAPRSLANYVDRGKLPAEAVIAIAVGYGVHPVGALVATGYLAPKYAREVDPVTALREVSDDQIADEVLRRLKSGSHPAFETPIDEIDTRRSRHLSVAADAEDDPDADLDSMPAVAHDPEDDPEDPDDGDDHAWDV